MTAGGRKLVLALVAVALAFALCLPASSPANAPLDDYSLTVLDGQAGGHPDLHASFSLTSRSKLPKTACGCNVVKDIIFNTPPGLNGIPTNIPTCTSAEFAVSECPVDSQVGVAMIQVEEANNFVLGIFNMVPRSDQAGLLAIETPFRGADPIYTSFTVRTEGDYGLEAKTFSITRIVELNDVDYIFWGVPGDPVHDALRFPPDGYFFKATNQKSKQFGCPVSSLQQLLEGINPRRQPDGICAASEEPPLVHYNAEVHPFINAPTNCSGATLSSLDILAYDQEFSHLDAPFAGMTGCSLLSFNPSQSINPTTAAADSPSGAEFVLKVPQPFSPSAPSASQLRTTDVTLPEGFTVAPNLTNGKTACTDAQAKIGSREQAECPEASKIGLISVESPALPGPLTGAAYLGEPKPGDRYRLLLTFDGFGFHIKLPGSLILDRQNGQIGIRFSELPQAPFSRFTAHFFGAERGPLATPTRCGTYEVKTVFTPWAESLPDQTSRQFFTIDSGPDGTPCPDGIRRFGPTFNAGAVDNTGGAHTPLSVDLTRADGEQNLTHVQIATPPGLTATLAGIPDCPESAVARLGDPLYTGLSELSSSACPPASRVGNATVATGAGTHPLYIGGSVYLAGPYKGAPLSFLTVVPAVSGPYDLGNVTVRAAVYVNPLTAQVTTVADPLPQIVEGIPLRLRQLRLELDRPGFILNPTNCDAGSIDATFNGDEGSIAHLSSAFQVANCADLDYHPRLRLQLSGGVNRRGHPAIHALFADKPGEANPQRISVTLPKGELLDNAHLGGVCTRVDFAAERCPARSLIGQAEASTPLLDKPLKGPVYLRSSSHDLPDIAIALDGQVDIELVGRVDSVDARLRTTFEALPDAPVSRFSLDLFGGSKGLLQNTESLCGRTKKATTRLVGQNGARFDTKTKLEVACRSKRARTRHRADDSARRAGSR